MESTPFPQTAVWGKGVGLKISLYLPVAIFFTHDSGGTVLNQAETFMEMPRTG
jgi:hypothetical protein